MAANKYQYTSTAPELVGKRVLVVGHRPAIADVLERLAVPFAIWHDKPIISPPDCLHICTLPFVASQPAIRNFALSEFSSHGPFTHVIAGTEAAVPVASVCRRALQARQAKDSIALHCSDKQHMKLLMQSCGIPMADFIVQADALSPEYVFERLGPKVVIKQRASSGGRGLSIAAAPADIADRQESNLLYETFIDAAELSIESFVDAGEVQFTSTTNYLIKTHANIVPANVPEHVLQQATVINRQVIEALQLEWGLTHAEFYWRDDVVLFGEVALRPPGGYIMECMSLAHGFDAWEAFVANELDLPYVYNTAGECTAGAALLHAGAGIVEAIENERAARKLPSCVRLRVLLKPGDREAARRGVAEVSAYGLFASNSTAATEADVRKCLSMLRFIMVDEA